MFSPKLKKYTFYFLLTLVINFVIGKVFKTELRSTNKHLLRI